MKINHLLLLLVFVFSLFSCDVKSDKATPSGRFVSEKSFRLGDFKTILPLDSFSSSDDRIRGYVDKDGFFFYNSKTRRIYTYALVDSLWQLENITKVPLEPDNNFKSVTDIYYHNKDSIFIYDISTLGTEFPDLYLIDIHGKIINSYKLINFDEGDPVIVPKYIAFSTPTFFFHKDKIYMAVNPNNEVINGKQHPLLVYDLKSGKKEFKGKLPVDPKAVSYAVYTEFCQIAFNPELEEIYFSWAFDEFIHRYKITTDNWDRINITSSYFNPPETWVYSEDIVKYGEYLLGNDWYLGIYYDRSTNRIHRLVYHGDFRNIQYSGSTSLIEGLAFSPIDNRIYVASIDPVNGDFDVIPFLDHSFRTFMFHPEYGPLIRTELNDAYGLDAEDFIVLAPIEIY